jgi:CBS domain-containing protein
LNEEIVKKVAIKDKEIYTEIIDYGIPRRDRPTLGKVNYEQLKSGKITINDKDVKVSSLSSLKKAREIADTLKKWIEEASFLLSNPVEKLPTETIFKPMKQTSKINYVKNLIHEAVTCTEQEEIGEVAQRLIKRNVNHILVVNEENELKGIVTSWDITKATATGNKSLEKIIVRRVHSTTPDEPIETASRRMAQHNISALPVIDRRKKVLGIVTSEDISRLLGGFNNG